MKKKKIFLQISGSLHLFVLFENCNSQAVVVTMHSSEFPCYNGIFISIGCRDLMRERGVWTAGNILSGNEMKKQNYSRMWHMMECIISVAGFLTTFPAGRQA